MADLHTPNMSAENVKNYRDGFNSLFKIMVIMWGIIFILSAALVYCVFEVRPQDRFFSVNSNGSVGRMLALDDPNINNNSILSWASQAAVDVLTFGFNDLEVRFSETRKNFTDKGWDSFRSAAISADVMSKIKERRQIITAIPAEPAEMLYYGIISGSYSWVVRVPTIISVRSAGQKSSSRVTVIMTIVRTPTKENPRAIGIDLWVSG
jgi:hypothetical protein